MKETGQTKGNTGTGQIFGVLCEYDEKWNVLKMFDIAVTSQVTRNGSYFSEYNYAYENLEVSKIVKKVIPKQVIPERTVVILEE